MHLHLIVPELFWSRDDPIAAHGDMVVTAIETLVARGRKEVRPSSSLEAWLLEAFGMATTDRLPVAPFALAGEGLVHGDRDWMCVDPVHLRVERDDFTLFDATTFSLDQGEAHAFIDVLNNHFHAQGLRFLSPVPTRWYMSSPTPMSATTTTLDQARGRSVDGLRPTGPGALTLQAVLNEVQMLLHQHPANEARERRGILPVNSVWPWGMGRMIDTRAPRLSVMHADNALALGLARTAGITARPLAGGLETVLADPLQQGVVWTVLDALRAPAAYRDVAAWRAALFQLEVNWFGPATDALRRGRLGMLTILAIGPSSTLVVETTASDLRYIWRWRKNLAAYINDSGSCER